MRPTRRNVLTGLCAGSAQLLFSQRLAHAILPQTGQEDASVAPPGLLDLTLTALSDGILKISISPANDLPKYSELGVVTRTLPQPLMKHGPVKSQTIPWGKYSVQIASVDGQLRITASEKDKIRQEIRFDLDSTDVRFDIRGPVFGLGEGGHPFDRRGTRDDMINGQNSPDLRTFGARVPIPWVISPEAWGVFVGQPSGVFNFTQTEAHYSGSEATATRNVFMLLGNTPADVLYQYATLTGFPHLPPRWAFGYQQSHRTLASREEILSEVNTFREKKLPCDAVIYLGTGFTPSGWNTGHGSFTFNKYVFPDPEVMLKHIHEKRMKVIVHIVPPGDFHGKVTDTGETSEASGDAATYWGKHAELVKTGIDGWWPDEGDRLNVYARLERNQMYWEGSRLTDPTKRPFALHRNGYAGMQRFAWLWSGDTFSTWDALRAQIMVGISTGLTGIPYWGTDTGGFVPTVEYTPELWIRWFQFSAFCPSFRSHGRAWKLHLPWGWNLGSAEPKEVSGDWVGNWPPEADLHRSDVEGLCRKYLNLRYQLLPYLYSTAAQAHSTGLPIIRALWLSFPRDKRTLLIDDSYMWGDSILVAPVHERDATTRKLYLPEGDWWNYWTKEQVKGGQEITVPAAVDEIPLFVKAGAILTVGPIKQHVDETAEEPVTLHIYPGSSNHFDWYDDDGSTFEFEHGSHMKVACEWNDQSRILTMTRDVTSKMGAGYKLRVTLVGTNRTQDIQLIEQTTQVKL